jgi:hypothetical protein
MTALVRVRYTLEFKQEAVRLVPGKANDLREQPKREATANFEHHEKFAECNGT